ncbi:MAG: universal stress protein [Dehalococcoidia bacterium]|nr:universal stress protein [Dehalococcoidia bacterium]
MSEHAEYLLEHAKEIATARAIPEVVLLKVVESALRLASILYVGEDKAAKAEARASKSAKAYLAAVKERLGLSASHVSTVVVAGEPAETILDYIETNGVDLVVMRTHGRSGVSKWFLGSVAERILRRSVAPLFLVPSVACRVRTS